MISIVIIVKNDRRIERCLTAIQSIDKPGTTEIVVVDASLNSLKDIQRRFPEVKWIHYKPDPSKITTIPEQRNLGIHKSAGKIIVFLDADMVPSRRWLREIVKPIKEGKEDFVCGHIRMKGYMAIVNPSGQYANYCGNGNMAITRRLINDIGVYDERFPVAEDMEFCMRARQAGYRIKIAPRAIADHPREDNLWKNIKKEYLYGRGALAVYRKHRREMLDFRNPHVIYTAVYAIYIALLPLTILVPLYPLIIIVPIVVNYKRSPLKEVINIAHGAGTLVELCFPSLK